MFAVSYRYSTLKFLTNQNTKTKFLGSTGTVQTLNFADNGRHLANQDYNICIRQEEGFCGIAYEPCHENAFKIAPNSEGK